MSQNILLIQDDPADARAVSCPFWQVTEARLWHFGDSPFAQRAPWLRYARGGLGGW